MQADFLAVKVNVQVLQPDQPARQLAGLVHIHHWLHTQSDPAALSITAKHDCCSVVSALPLPRAPAALVPLACRLATLQHQAIYLSLGAIVR